MKIELFAMPLSFAFTHFQNTPVMHVHARLDFVGRFYISMLRFLNIHKAKSAHNLIT